jgi:hypothetical protein
MLFWLKKSKRGTRDLMAWYQVVLNMDEMDKLPNYADAFETMDNCPDDLADAVVSYERKREAEEGEMPIPSYVAKKKLIELCEANVAFIPAALFNVLIGKIILWLAALLPLGMWLLYSLVDINEPLATFVARSGSLVVGIALFLDFATLHKQLSVHPKVRVSAQVYNSIYLGSGILALWGTVVWGYGDLIIELLRTWLS